MMHPVIKNIFAVVVGVVVGAFVNNLIILLSGLVIPAPEGVDNTTVEGLKAGFHLFEPKHYIFPFLAHAIGTFVGALLTTFIAVKSNFILAMFVGVVFLLGGISMVIILPETPVWFMILDLAMAYLPMAYFANKIAIKK